MSESRAQKKGDKQAAIGGPRKVKGTISTPGGFMIWGAPPGACLCRKAARVRGIKRPSEKDEHTNVDGRMVTGGTQQRWVGMDTDRCGPGGRRSLTRPSKLINKTEAGSVKDVIENGSGRSGGALTTGQAVSSELKGNPQPIITDFPIKGAKATVSIEPLLPQESSDTYRIVYGGSNNGILEPEQSGAKPVLIPAQMVETQNMTENQTIELMGVTEGTGFAGFITNIDRIHSEYKRDQQGNPADILTEPNGTKASRNWSPIMDELLIREKQDAESGQA
ncbi:hypothetical protein NDU88_005824 [Pleurodeles waltl]|uniref:Uncharacterized protein n=1 Tax=Pleurodeles waltl TaxID=8319 RepID=A0AAV7TVF5_PLEWA|nr:hypothetical protein NDU88_005824 [Pleurodeles waltl]